MKSLEKIMACAITRYDCDNPDDKKHLETLIAVAKKQEENFTSIFPWNAGCTAPRHYVAQKADGTICGWMTVIPRASRTYAPKHTYLYLAEISVTRVQDESFRGVGKRLHDRLVADATAEGRDFVYLYPLNADVAKTYVDKWGYTQLSGAEFLTYKVKDIEIPPALVRRLNPTLPTPRRYTIEALDAVRGNPEAEAIVGNRTYAYNVQNDAASLDALDKAINAIATYEMMEEEGEPDIPSLEERQQMIVDIFLAAPKAERSLGGRKKTRRRPRRRRTLRKRFHLG